MPSTFSTNLNLELQATGEHAGTWGAVLNSGDFQILDNVLGAVQTISLSNVDVTLNTAQTQVNYIKLTGALSGNVNVIFPAIGRTFFVANNTTGNFTVTLKIGAGATIVIPSGMARFYVLDDTNVVAETAAVGTQTSVASASTTDLGLIGSHNALITGTTTITSLGSSANAAYPLYLISCSSALPFTQSAGLLLPGNVNFTMAAGSYAFALYLGSGNWQILAVSTPGAPAFPIMSGGQFTTASSTVARLVPYKGNQVTFPSGATAVIPAAGISSTITNAFLNGASGQTLSVTTRYYAYLWNQGSAAAPNYVIDWSTTGHVPDTNTGIEIKSGDATRVLVGMAYPQAGPIFANDATKRLVASWNNRIPKQMLNNFTTNHSVSPGAVAEINSQIRCNFLSWGDAATFSYNGQFSAAGTIGATGGPSLDADTTNYFGTSVFISSSGTGNSLASGGTFIPSEGFHFVTEVGSTSGGTGSFVAVIGSQGLLSGVVVS